VGGATYDGERGARNATPKAGPLRARRVTINQMESRIDDRPYDSAETGVFRQHA